MESVQDIEKTLEEAGLTKTETKVYLTLIKKGPSTAYRISLESGLYKANTYMAIEGLVKKNFVKKEEINNKHIFKAVDPEEFVNNLERKKEKIQAIIPFIQRNFHEELEEVSVFTGVEAFFNILYSLLNKKSSIKVFDIPSYVPEIVTFQINQFHKERIKKKVAMYHIYDYDAKDRIKFLRKIKYTYAKQGQKNRLSVTSTLVCGDTTLIINWKKGLKTVKIIDKDIAETFNNQFDILWNYK
ncbi:MAG: helix-turn-helix domain-containing protein [archaeon]|nr:helix-turn-helix domain-containing protein [archaeon]